MPAALWGSIDDAADGIDKLRSVIVIPADDHAGSAGLGMYHHAVANVEAHVLNAAVGFSGE